VTAKASAAVIGAGMGGLSAAIALAARGLRVTVFEQLDRPGGKLGELHTEGFRWDTGPSVITMRDVFESLFARAGRRLEDYVELTPLEPITRYFWRDGLTLDAVSDEAAMRRAIAAFSAVDADGYSDFMRHTAALFRIVKEPFLYRRKPGLRDLAGLPMRDALKIDAFRSMHASVRTFFSDPRLVQLFDRFATYNGSSPYQAPATLNTIAHVEMAGGAYYPRGGVFALARAFERLAIELGVTICYGARVRKVLVSGGRARGVATDIGMVDTDLVVCNADYAHARATLLRDKPHTDDQAMSRFRPSRVLRAGLEPSCSGFVLFLGVRGAFDQLAHHNIFFGADYPREFDDIFKRKRPADDPTLYVCITSKTDSAHAPAGHENWFVLVNAPYLNPGVDWAREAGPYAERVLESLCAQSGLRREQIVTREIMTPADIQTRYGGHFGAIYGYSSNSMWSAFMRPANRDGVIRRLYYASGSAHPGGGVPLVTLSGMAAADCALEDLALRAVESRIA
jgi:phytoene desaturase